MLYNDNTLDKAVAISFQMEHIQKDKTYTVENC